MILNVMSLSSTRIYARNTESLSPPENLHFPPVNFLVPISIEAVVNIIEAMRGEPVASSRPHIPVRFVIARFSHPPCIVCSPLVSLARSLRPVSVLLACPFFTCSRALPRFAPAPDSIVVHSFRLQIARLDYITKPQTHQRKDRHCLDMQSIPA